VRHFFAEANTMLRHCLKNTFFPKRNFIIFLLFFVFLTLNNIYTEPGTNKGKTDKNEDSKGISEESESPWEVPDISPEFPELQILEDISGKKSMEYFQAAENLYLEARKILQNSDEKVQDKQEEVSVDRVVKFDWEKQEENARLKKIERKVQSKTRMKALGKILEALEILDKIKNPTLLKSENYSNLESKILRQYIKLQYQSGNYTQSISAIEKYFTIKESHKNEPEPHKILAICYDKQALMADKAGDIKHKNIFLYKKNIHMLKYAEISYGKDSKEYESLKKRMIQPIYMPEE
jgi:hypothetical protein